jgi:hypothetical protein
MLCAYQSSRPRGAAIETARSRWCKRQKEWDRFRQGEPDAIAAFEACGNRYKVVTSTSRVSLLPVIYRDIVNPTTVRCYGVVRNK